MLSSTSSLPSSAAAAEWKCINSFNKSTYTHDTKNITTMYHCIMKWTHMDRQCCVRVCARKFIKRHVKRRITSDDGSSTYIHIQSMPGTFAATAQLLVKITIFQVNLCGFHAGITKRLVDGRSSGEKQWERERESYWEWQRQHMNVNANAPLSVGSYFFLALPCIRYIFLLIFRLLYSFERKPFVYVLLVTTG